MTSLPAGHASPNKAGRPSLYTTALESHQPVEVRGDSILDGLEQPRRHRIRLAGLLGIGLASAIAVGWWQAGGLVREKDVGPAALAAATQTETANAPAAVPKEQAAQSAPGEEARAADRPAEQMPAIVIAESNDGDGMPASVSHEPSTGKPSAPAQVAANAVKASLQPANSGDTMAAVPAQAASTSIATPAIAQEKVAEHAHAPDTAAKAKQKTPASANVQLAAKSPSSAKAKDGYINTSKSAGAGETRNKPAEKDGDVELIAALLNRVSAKTEPASEETLRKSASGKGTVRQASADQKKARKTAPPRESAAPAVMSAETQLKRCGSLNFLESELCRIRVCEGRWGRESGCPEYSHASAALP